MANKSSKCASSLEKVQDAVNAADAVTLETFGLTTETMIAMLNGISDPKIANNFLLKTIFLKAEGILYEGAMGSMLSGVGSHLLNMSTNGFTYAFNLVDTGLSVASANLTGDAIRRTTANRQALEQLSDLGATISDFGKLVNPFNGTAGWRAIGHKNPDGSINPDLPLDLWHHPDFVGSQQASVRTGYVADPKQRKGAAGKRPELVKATSKQQERQISSTNLGISTRNPIGRGVGIGVDTIGAVVNSFGNAMRHEDLAAKTLQFRLSLRRLAREKAEKIVRGKMEKEGWSEAQALEAMDEYAEAAFRYPDENILTEAAKKADDDTFTGELGTAAGFVRNALQLPVLRLLTPFFKTLANITNYGVRKSPVGELGRALHIYKGEDYWTKLGEKSARGDAARSQLSMSAFMVYGTYEYLGVDPYTDGHGFTGHLDMTNPIQRQRALTVAPPFSWKTKSGTILDFKDYPQIQFMMGMYSGSREMLSKIEEGRDYFDPDTGAKIDDPAMFIWDVTTTPFEHAFGNYFAMESISKINTLFETLLKGEEGADQQAYAMMQDIATMWAIPAVVKDINAVGALAEQRFEVEEGKRFFNDQYQQANSLLARIDNAWFGSETSGVKRDMHGNEMQSKHNLTRQVQSHKLSNWPEKPDEVDFKMYEMENVRLLDNPEFLSLPGLGTTIRLTGKQTDDFMVLLGKGGNIKEAGMYVKSQREFLKDILFHPEITRRPRWVQEGMIQGLIRDREGAFKLLFVEMNPELKEQARENLIRKQQLLTGDLSIKGPGYFPQLFEYINDTDSMIQNALSNSTTGN